MKILITGANGMLGKAIINEFKDEDLVITTKQDLDITDVYSVINCVHDLKPDYIINCAAYTDVDRAEDDFQLAKSVNSQGPKFLAIAAEAFGSTLIHISTDYVFEGNKTLLDDYSENDKKSPKSVYGITKAWGEDYVTDNCYRHYIFRTSWLFGDGDNFVKTMLNLGRTKDNINVVSDQHGFPTYTVDLASAIHQAISKSIPYGTYNMTNSGYATTWYEFAKLIFDTTNINCNIKRVTTKEYEKLSSSYEASRPLNSKLSTSKLSLNGITLPNYIDALKRYLKEIGEI